MRILIAEDEVVTARILEQGDAIVGHETVLVKDGPTALAQLTAADGPKLALLDWMMPSLDGPDVCRQIRDGDATVA